MLLSHTAHHVFHYAAHYYRTSVQTQTNIDFEEYSALKLVLCGGLTGSLARTTRHYGVVSTAARAGYSVHFYIPSLCVTYYHYSCCVQCLALLLCVYAAFVKHSVLTNQLNKLQ